MRLVLDNGRGGREGEAGTTPFGSRRQMRPHSFFSFIPSVTFTACLLTPRPSLLQRPPFLTLYSLGFTPGWNNNLHNAFSSRATGARTSGDKDGKCSLGHYQHVGASFGSFQVLFLLVTQVPIPIFLTIFLPSFWLFSFASPRRLDFLQCLGWKRSHYNPPPHTPTPCSIHSFWFFILF